MFFNAFHSIRTIPTHTALQIYQLMRVGSLMLIGIILAKSGLSLSELGNWEALLYVGSMVVFMGVNGLLQGMSPIVSKLPDVQHNPFFVQAFSFFTALGLFTAGLFWFGRAWVIPALTGQAELLHFDLFCAYLLFQIATLPTEIIYLLKKKPLSILAWGFLAFGLQIPVVVIPIFTGQGLQGALWGLLILNLLKWLWTVYIVFFPSGRRDSAAATPQLLRNWLQFSAPVVAATLIGNLIGLVDPLLVGHYFSESGVFAVFRYGSRELPLAMALATALGTAMVPMLTASPKEGLTELRERSVRLFHLVFPISIVLMLTAIWWFPRVFNYELAAAAPLFQIYLLITISRVLLPNSILLGLGDTQVLFRVGLLELVLKIGLGIALIGPFGLTGVAWSCVAAFWFEKIALSWHLARTHQIYPAAWVDLRWFLGYSIALILAYWVVWVI